MLLSSIVGKRIFVGATPRGICTGVGISLKNFTVKYILCSNTVEPWRERVDFALPFSCMNSVDEVCIHTSKTRAVFPKTCAQIFLQKPVFTFDGMSLGNVTDVSFSLTNNGNFTADFVYTDKNETFSAGAIYAFLDAVILKKDRPYPLGQRIPAPILSRFGNNQTLVSKAVLQRAIQQNALIRFTLALPPFNRTLL